MFGYSEEIIEMGMKIRITYEEIWKETGEEGEKEYIFKMEWKHKENKCFEGGN